MPQRRKSNSIGTRKISYWKQVDKSARELSREYFDLLEQRLTEQAYQTFLEENTRLIPREFVQNHGIHFNLVLRKLPFGADYKSDFAYLSKSSDDWNCVLVEIERPGRSFFKDNTNVFHPRFDAALQQINSWRGWLLNDANRINLCDAILTPIRKPLERNPVFLKFVLVYGRRSEYAGNDIRRRLISSQERDDFKILTFDSLAENLEGKNDLYIAARRNEYIDVLSDTFLSESMFSWMQPEHIRISKKFAANARAYRAGWNHHNIESGKGILAMERALKTVRIRGGQAE